MYREYAAHGQYSQPSSMRLFVTSTVTICSPLQPPVLLDVRVIHIAWKHLIFLSIFRDYLPSVLFALSAWTLLGVRKSIRPVKIEQ